MLHKIRILKALKKRYPELSQKQIKNYLDMGCVKVNARPMGRHSWVSVNDELQITGRFSFELEANADVACDLIKLTEDYIFLEKPPCVHAVALRYEDTETVANWLLSVDDKLRSFGPALEAGLLHRLDYETSGIMLAARHLNAFQSLKEQFKAQTVNKNYICHVTQAPPAAGVYTAFAGQKSSSSAKIFVRQQDHNAFLKKIKTEILSSKKIAEGRFEVNLRLISGHRHQIRAHMAYMGCPLLGDELYGGSSAERLYLHASEISFCDAAGQLISVRSCKEL